MTPRQKLEEAIQEFVGSAENEHSTLLNTNWVLGWETTHTNPDPESMYFLYAHDWTHSEALGAAGAVGLANITARSVRDAVMGFE